MEIQQAELNKAKVLMETGGQLSTPQANPIIGLFTKEAAEIVNAIPHDGSVESDQSQQCFQFLSGYFAKKLQSQQ